MSGLNACRAFAGTGADRVGKRYVSASQSLGGSAH